MCVGSEGQSGRGPPAPLDFHTWYWQRRERLNGAIFRSCFFRWPPLEIFLPTPLRIINTWITCRSSLT